MARSIIVRLAVLAALMLLTACPRDSSGGASTAGNGQVAPPVSGEDLPDMGSAEGSPASGDVAPPEATEQGETGAAAEVDTEATEEEKGADVTVVLETTKGDIVLSVHRNWSPLGADHFLELVKAGYYDGAPWFRVFKDPNGISVAQCGMAADPAVTAQWMNQTINDEPVVEGNKRGTVAFGKSALPNSRSTHIFINITDNSFALDPQGFSCFAEVTQGMEVVDTLTETGSTTVNQATLAQRGIEYFREVVPEGDVIQKAHILN